MLKLYFSLELKIICRIFKAMGIVPSLMVLAVFAALLFYMSGIPAHFILVVYMVLALSIQQARKDKILLQNLFGMKYRFLLMAEDLLLGIPFYFVLFLQKSYLQMLLIVVMVIFLPFIPSCNTDFRLPTHPLMQKGSMEYKRSMRLYGFFYLLLIAASFIGFCYGNIRITKVAMWLDGIILGFLLLMPVTPTYLYHYASSGHLIRSKVLLTFYNNLILILPFLLLYMCYQPSWQHLGSCFVAYFSTSLLLLQVNFLRFLFSSDNILEGFIYFALVGVCLLTIAFPLLLLLSLAITLFLVCKDYLILKAII